MPGSRRSGLRSACRKCAAIRTPRQGCRRESATSIRKVPCRPDGQRLQPLPLLPLLTRSQLPLLPRFPIRPARRAAHPAAPAANPPSVPPARPAPPVPDSSRATPKPRRVWSRVFHAAKQTVDAAGRGFSGNRPALVAVISLWVMCGILADKPDSDDFLDSSDLLDDNVFRKSVLDCNRRGRKS